MRILFICTHNRCRSILSEAILNHFHSDLIEARSAGSQPAGQVHPLSLTYLSAHGISIEGLTSQSWDTFESFKPDVVITVCDNAAKETCPIWFGNAIQIHWGLSDPSKIKGNEADVAHAFNQCIDIIKNRAILLAQLANKKLDSTEFKHELQQLIQNEHEYN